MAKKTKYKAPEIGEIYEDQDRRHPGRRVTVIELKGKTGAPHAVRIQAVEGGRRTWVSVARLQSADYRKVEVAEPKMAADTTPDGSGLAENEAAEIESPNYGEAGDDSGGDE